MSGWTSGIKPVPPAALETAAQAITSFATTVNTTLDTAEKTLSAASKFVESEISPLATTAQTAATQIKQFIADFYGADYHTIALHPWQFGVGSGEGLMINLPFPVMIRKLIAKLKDTVDPKCPAYSSQSEIEFLVIAVGSPSLSLFKTRLKALSELLDLDDFRVAIRRIEQAFELNSEQYIQPNSSKNPSWNSLQIRDIPAIRKTENSVRSLEAMFKGYANASDSSLDILINLIAQKKKQIAGLNFRLQEAVDTFKKSIASDHVRMLYAKAQGTAGIASALSKAGNMPGNELTLCACVCFVAPAPGLEPLKKLLGV